MAVCTVVFCGPGLRDMKYLLITVVHGTSAELILPSSHAEGFLLFQTGQKIAICWLNSHNLYVSDQTLVTHDTIPSNFLRRLYVLLLASFGARLTNSRRKLLGRLVQLLASSTSIDVSK